jgi:hypothetical protein
MGLCWVRGARISATGAGRGKKFRGREGKKFKAQSPKLKIRPKLKLNGFGEERRFGIWQLGRWNFF